MSVTTSDNRLPDVTASPSMHVTEIEHCNEGGMEENSSLIQRHALRFEAYKSLLDEGFPVPDFLEDIQKWQFLKDCVFNHSIEVHLNSDSSADSLNSEQYRACTDLDPGLRSLLRCLCEGRRERLSELIPLIQQFLSFDRRIVIADHILLESIPILCIRKPLGGLLKGTDRKIQTSEDPTAECLWVWEVAPEALPDIAAVRDVFKYCKDARDKKSKKVKLLYKLVTAVQSNNVEAAVKHEDSLIKLERKELMEEEKQILRARKLAEIDKQKKLNDEEKSKKAVELKDKKEEKKKEDVNGKSGSSTVMFSWLKKVSTNPAEDTSQSKQKCKTEILDPTAPLTAVHEIFPELASGVDNFLSDMDKTGSVSIASLRSALWSMQEIQCLKLRGVLKTRGATRKYYRQVPLIGTNKPTKTQLTPTDVMSMQKNAAYNDTALKKTQSPRRVIMHIPCDWKRPTRRLIICRRPHSVDLKSPLTKEDVLNYDIDTDEEWEEAFGGEDVYADDAEEEEDDDIADVSGWMVPDDVVDYDTTREEDMKEEGGPHSPCVSRTIQGNTIVSCCFEGPARFRTSGDAYKDAMGQTEFKHMTCGKFRCDMQEVINSVNGICCGLEKKTIKKREMSEIEIKGLALFIHGRTDAGPKLVDEFSKVNPNLIKRSIEEQYKHIAVREKRDNDSRQFVYVRNDAALVLNIEKELRDVVGQRRLSGPNTKDSEDTSSSHGDSVPANISMPPVSVNEETQKGRKRSATDAAEDPDERHRKKKQEENSEESSAISVSGPQLPSVGSQRKMRRMLPHN